jgi:hypothetical protein
MEEEMAEKFISGYLRFEVIDGILHTITDYKIKDGSKFTKKELEEIMDYTQGQWSDGIGENFEQIPINYANNTFVYLSPYFHKQKVEHIIDPKFLK